MSNSKNKCVFNNSWLNDSRFSLWLKKSNTNSKAYCNFCQKDFDISNMGITALTSHQKGKKHTDIKKLRESKVGESFFQKSSLDLQSSSCNKTKITVESLVVPVSALRAEIIWTLKVAMNHFSLRSCLGLNEIFKAMFTDSEIAKSFKLSKTKCGYFINYGLAPFFKELLLRSINESEFFVLSYDESMNKVLQEEQMDVNIRYWDNTLNEVCTRFYDSHFIKRANAANLLDCLNGTLKELIAKRMIQLSMDGPNTNWKVLELLHSERCEDDLPSILNIGSCGLHVIHGAFKTGVEATDWSLNKVLKAMWKIFHDSPARRDTYIEINECWKFPLPFCATRWVEDEGVAERAMELWPNIVKLVRHYQGLAKSYRPKNNGSYDTLVKHHLDIYMPLKMQFFQDIASCLRNYLVLFQTDDPMVPFIEKALVDVFKSLMKMVVKPDVLEKADTTFKLIKLDLSEPENLLLTELINLPTATKSMLSKSGFQKDKKTRLFKSNCKSLLVALISKLQERSPLKYGIVRFASSLSPENILSKKNRCIQFFEKLCDKLYECSWLSSKEADKAKQEYTEFVRSANSILKLEFLTYDPKRIRLDHFYRKVMDVDSLQNCWKVCKLVLTLSHGQAAVERGFSVNKEILVENLEKKSLVSQRLVVDYLHHSGKEIWELPLPKEMLNSCRKAHTRYVVDLEKNKSEKVETEKDLKRKLKQEEVTEVEKKKRALMSSISALQEDIDTYSCQAEQEGNMELLSKANAFRVKVKEQKKTLSELENALLHLNEEMKNV